MSLLPLLLTSAWWTNFERPHQNIALVGLPNDIMLPRGFDRYHPNLHDRMALDFYYRPWMDLLHRRDGDTMSDKDNFKVIIDVRQFKPEEISVKVVDRWIVVEAKHEEKQDEHGSISRQFIRKYLLPDRADVDQVSSTISNDGVLTIMAPLRKTPIEPNERVIKIELTGQPALRPDTEGEVQSTTKASTTPNIEKKVEENEIREELTTQGQEDGAKPVK